MLWDPAGMTSRPRTLVLLTGAGLVGLTALTACSSSSDSAAATPGTASPIGGMTTCDVAALTQPAAEAVTAQSSDMKLDQVDEVECGDGWAAVFADVSGADASASADGYTITLVFEQEGQFWIPKDRTEVCGTPSSADPAARPDDAQVPASIWAAACNTN